MDMIEVSWWDVSPILRELFSLDVPQARRCFAVLDGSGPQGKIICDDPVNPKWAVVLEPVDRSLFFGGSLDILSFQKVFNRLRHEGDVLVGLWNDDPYLDFLPPRPDYDGRTLEFYDRPIGRKLDDILNTVPTGCELVRMDKELVLRTEWGPGDVALAGGIEAWEKSCFGYCLVRGEEILSEASVGPPAVGLFEPGVFTQPEHRGKGYATLTAARIIQEIETAGGKTYWNCAKQNLASAAVARKLGYTVEKEYRCMMWEKTN